MIAKDNGPYSPRKRTNFSPGLTWTKFSLRNTDQCKKLKLVRFREYGPKKTCMKLFQNALIK